MARNSVDPLFNQAPLSAVLDHQDEALGKAVEQLPADRVRDADEAEIVPDMVERFSIASIEFTEGAISVEAEEAQVDVSGSWDRDTMDGGPYFVPGVRVSYYVPFTGDRDLFKYQPSTHSFHLPRAEIRTGELAFHFEDPDNNVTATKARFDDEFRRTREWASWVNQDVARFNSGLPAKAAQLVSARRSRLRQVTSGTNALGIPIRSSAATPSTPRSASPPKPSVVDAMYDVALSFAGENRLYVERVAEALRAAGVKVFYDAFEKADLWGKNLVDHLADVYQKRSRFVVMFVSEHYVRKAWPKHERQHAQARALVAKEEYILPARFDDSDVPGMTATVAYVDLRHVSPEELSDMIKAKLR